MRLLRYRPFAPFLIVGFLAAGCAPGSGSSPAAPVKTEASGISQPANTKGPGTAPPAKAVEGS